MIDFQQFLNDNSSFLPSTKRIYFKVVKQLINENNENPTIEQLNHFIAVKCGKRQPHVKYAIKEYLRFINRTEDYHKLNKAKIREPIKENNFLSREQVDEIINLIENQKHKDIAVLQYNTAARASEILTLRKPRIKKEKYFDEFFKEERERIRLTVRGKGERARYLYLLPGYWKHIEPYYNTTRDYLFFGEKELTYIDFWLKVENTYHRYLESLKKAAEKIGLNIGTHDLRSSFSMEIKKTTGDIYKLQKVLGHKNIDTTIRYLKNRNEDIAESMLDTQKRA